MRPPVAASRWAPVVYGRTLNADIWWRALPSPFDRQGTEGGAVLAAVGDGRALSRSPRFALARGHAGTLVGVACQASELSPDMNSDGRRPLFCFVGWFCADPQAGAPRLAILEEHWRSWAADVYERWMRPAWNAHLSRLRVPSETDAEVPPWHSPDMSPSGTADVWPEHGYPMLAETPGHVRVHPSAERAWVWQAVARYGRNTTLVTGWGSAREARLDGVTDVCADDVSGTEPLLVPAPGTALAAGPAIRETPPVIPTADPPRDVTETPAPGRLHRDVRKIRERADRLLRGDAGRDFPPPPEPPPPPRAHGRWLYEQRHHAFYSQVGGLLSCWNGYQLFYWDRDHWVAQTPLLGAEDEISPRDRAAPGTHPPPPAAKIEQLSTGFGEFDQAPRARPGGDQYSSSWESGGESKDS